MKRKLPVHPSRKPIEDFLKDCEIKSGRTGGPGGQHRNRNSTAVFITHKPTGIEAHADERRERKMNEKNAIFRLRLRLAILERYPELPYASDQWNERIVGKQIKLNPTHEDCPAMIAEALDYLYARQYDMKKAAFHFNTSTSQLIKMLKLHPEALFWLNEKRKSKSMRPLK